MKIVNPIGRDASSYVDANYDVQPSACMCGYTSTFSSALGYQDNCSHCGCNCKPTNSEANFNKAYNAGRQSYY